MCASTFLSPSRLLVIAVLAVSSVSIVRAQNQSGKAFHPGEVWLDTDGKPIDAHGGGIWRDPATGVYFWYGESKPGPNTNLNGGVHRTDVVGVACYSSRDLYNWKNEGLVLRARPDDPSHDLHPSMVLERPKVIYNARSKKYVMWMHVDDGTYQKASAGVAVSDHPAGPFEYLRSVRPLGAESRDMTLFADDDGAAYLIFSSENNRTTHIARLTDDYLDFTGDVARVFIGQKREAPVLFKDKGLYYMITSGLSGWLPNEAQYTTATQIMGPWKNLGNPCIGENAETTYQGQGTYAVQAPGGQWIFMADRWNPESLKNSLYLWLPLSVDGEKVTIEWRPSWSYGNPAPIETDSP